MDIKLPELGEGVTEGELVKWLVKVGDTVSADQAVAEVMTDKATVEVPSPIQARVLSLKAKEGDTIKVGDTLIEAESIGGTQQKEVSQLSKAEVQKPLAPAGATVAGTPKFVTNGDIYPPVAGSHVLATPSTRRLAREMRVDVNSLKGTGLAGRVTRQDVVQAGDMEVHTQPLTVRAPSNSVDTERRVALKGVRKKIAEKMQMAKHVIPHFTIMDEANVSELVKMRTNIKDLMVAKNVKVTYLPFVIKALIATAREFPEFNSSIDDAASEIVYKDYFNIGFAADTPQGLLVPVIKNADQKSVFKLSQEITSLGEKARAGKLTLDEMRGATMTITNIGSVGGSYATPIINHPEVMIFGMYKISKRAVFDAFGNFKAVDVMNVTATADHRLIDGAVAARFLKGVIGRLENPGLLMMDLA